MTNQSQTKQIIEHLEQHQSITALEALNRFGCLRLAARVSDIRKEGYNVQSQRVVRNGKHVACYSL